MTKAIVLGTAQDGGLPHPGCRCPRCEAAWADPRRRRRVVCLGLVSGEAGFLIDATPDIASQLRDLPRLSGLLLTHAHMGHVAGLLWLGREGMAVRRLPVWLGARHFEEHLSGNEPWATLFRDRHLVPHLVLPDHEFELAPGLVACAIEVPHRGEWSETLAYRIRGPKRSLLWLPDIDRFEPGALEVLLYGIDFAFLDGTFWSDEELPGRDLSEIPHPRIRETAKRLAEIHPRAAVSFVHMNHSNPCLAPDAPQVRELEAIYREGRLSPAGGSPIAKEGEEIDLGTPRSIS